MEKLKTKLEWNERDKMLTVSEGVKLNDADIFSNYNTWTQQHGDLLTKVLQIKNQISELEGRIIEIKPYYDKIKDEVMTRLVMAKKKVSQ